MHREGSRSSPSFSGLSEQDLALEHWGAPATTAPGARLGARGTRVDAQPSHGPSSAHEG